MGKPEIRKADLRFLKNYKLFLGKTICNWPIAARKNQSKIIIQMGLKGNLKTIEIIFNYAFGKPKEIENQRVDLTQIIRPPYAS